MLVSCECVDFVDNSGLLLLLMVCELLIQRVCRRTAVAEMVPWKELQPRAFSIMPLVWSIGSILGPTLGGSLANPMRVKPGEPLRPNAGLLERFPYALPNLIAAAIFIFGIVVGLLFMEETLAVKRDRRDYGLLLGDKLKVVAKKTYYKALRMISGDRESSQDEENEPLLKPTPSAASTSTATDAETGVLPPKPKPTPPPPTIREVLHYQSVLNLLVYTLLALHNIAFDQLIPIFMHYPRTPLPPNSNPFKFAHGFGLDSARIGLLFTLYGVSGMLIQFFLFPPLARHYGVLRCLRATALAFPIIYIFVPFTALISSPLTQQIVLFALMFVKGVCNTFAFPSATILLTNSAGSLRGLGTLNGVATACGALGRAAGPALGGAVFTVGVSKGFIGAPWWVLSCVAAMAAVPVFWLVEGDGFGGDENAIIDSDDDEEEEVGVEEGESETLIVNRSRDRHEEESHARREEDYGAMGPLLSRTTTVSSVRSGDDYNADAEQRPQRRGSMRRKVSRKMSVPVGMNSPIARRYSSNLGQSLGSAGSWSRE